MTQAGGMIKVTNLIDFSPLPESARLTKVLDCEHYHSCDSTREYRIPKHSQKKPALINYITSKCAHKNHEDYEVAFFAMITHKIRRVALLQVLECLLHVNRLGAA